MKKTALTFASMLFLFANSAAAREVGGINVPDSITVDGKALKLNGAGIRKKFIVKVYTGALFLATPATTLDAIVSSDQAWSIQMTFLRSVGKAKMIDAYREGFEKNAKDKLAVLNAGLDKLAAAIPDAAEGTEYDVVYTPGKGLSMGVKGATAATVEGKEFAGLFLRNWLGAEPADEGLKSEMLSGK